MGTDNQTGGTQWRMGIFVESRGFAWFDDPDVKRSMDYSLDELIT